MIPGSSLRYRLTLIFSILKSNKGRKMKEKIKSLLKERKAIMLAHNYQPPEIQDLADLCGDSLELSIKASQTDAEMIVFCGVQFMAETASILCPDKTVLLPRMDAGCPMADMVTPEKLKKRLAELPEMPVVTYVNSTAGSRRFQPSAVPRPMPCMWSTAWRRMNCS
jgi:quinolinate synthetase A subunit